MDTRYAVNNLNQYTAVGNRQLGYDADGKSPCPHPQPLSHSVGEGSRAFPPCPRAGEGARRVREIAVQHSRESIHSGRESMHCERESIHSGRESMHCGRESMHCGRESMHCERESTP